MEKFNVEHKLLSFKVGEMVLLKALYVGHSADNTPAKFFSLYNGPFLLSVQVGKNMYIVMNHITNRTIGKFHASMGKRDKIIWVDIKIQVNSTLMNQQNYGK